MTKQSNQTHMKKKYDALKIRFALLGLFSFALNGPVLAGPGEMGMGKSMKAPCEQPFKGEQMNQGDCKKMEMKGMASHDGHKKGMQMKNMNSPDSGNGSGDANQGMGMMHDGNQGGMETQGK